MAAAGYIKVKVLFLQLYNNDPTAQLKRIARNIHILDPFLTEFI